MLAAEMTTSALYTNDAAVDGPLYADSITLNSLPNAILSTSSTGKIQAFTHQFAQVFFNGSALIGAGTAVTPVPYVLTAPASAGLIKSATGITVNVAGVYQVVHTMGVASGANNNTLTIYLRIGGVDHLSTIATFTLGTSGDVATLTGCALVPITAGQLVTQVTTSTSGAPTIMSASITMTRMVN
jgi:hypothetical protein